MLPSELSSISNPEERAAEFLHYRQFFKIWEMLDRVVECQSLEVGVVASKETKKAWLGDYQVCVFCFCFVSERLCWKVLIGWSVVGGTGS
jgi:hypothetical protein